jgi:hypothetical protein
VSAAGARPVAGPGHPAQPEATEHSPAWPPIITGFSVLAAVAAIPSFKELVIFLCGIPGVAASVWGWRKKGRARRAFLMAAGVLLFGYVILLLLFAHQQDEEAPKQAQASACVTPPAIKSSAAITPSPKQSQSSRPTASSRATRTAHADLPYTPKPVTSVIAQGSSHSFEDGRVLVGVDNSYSGWAALTV